MSGGSPKSQSVNAVSVQDFNMACCDDCNKPRGEKKRTYFPALAIKQTQVYRASIASTGKTQDLIDYKCLAKRNGNHKNIYYKVGLTGSSSRILQGVQAAGGFITPGNISKYRSPIRSGVTSALTPGGGGLTGPGFIKPDRGYRCPEGYQYGGRFTDSRFSTCGKKLFEIAKQLGESIGSLVTPSDRRRGFGEGVSGRIARGLEVQGQVTSVRDPQIPKVSAANGGAYRKSIASITKAMSGVPGKNTRMVRRDGFVLTPVVSAAVLRTVPDNRDMEGASYITSVTSLADVAPEDELGLLSNTGIQQLKYILPKGATLSLSKARPLSVGERRKLGRTVKSVNEVNTTSDPAARMKAIAAEMGNALKYEEDFGDIANPNELVEVSIAGSKNKKMVRRWYYETLLRAKGGKRQKIERGSIPDEAPARSEKISDLAAAVRHLNNGGSIDRISSLILATALKRSSLYKTGKIKNGLILHDGGPKLKYLETTRSGDMEFVNQKFRSELDATLGLKSPKVWRLGQGPRSPYLMEATSTVMGDDDEIVNAPLQNVDPQNLISIAVSDYLSNSKVRNPESLDIYKRAGKLVAVPNSSIGAGSTSTDSLDIETFFDRRRQEILAHFEKLSALQRRNVIMLLDRLLERAKGFQFDDLRRRMALDGELSSNEKQHLAVLEQIFKTRISRLGRSKESFMKVIGLK